MSTPKTPVPKAKKPHAPRPRKKKKTPSTVVTNQGTLKKASKELRTKLKVPTTKELSRMSKEEQRRLLTDWPTTQELTRGIKKIEFLKALATRGTVSGACKETGVSYTSYQLWTDPSKSEYYGVNSNFDPDFQVAVADSLAKFRDKVIQTGVDRAVTGWVDKKYDRNGVLMSEDNKYDSSILQMLMKRADPSLKDKGPEVNINNNQLNIGADQSSAVLDALSPEQKKLLLQMVELEQGKKKAPDEPLEGEVVPQSD